MHYEENHKLDMGLIESSRKQSPQKVPPEKPNEYSSSQHQKQQYYGERGIFFTVFLDASFLLLHLTSSTSNNF